MKKSTFAASIAVAAFVFVAHAETALYFDGNTYIDIGKKFPIGDSVSLSAWIRISPTITVNPPTGSGFPGAGIVGQGYWGGTTGFGIFVSGSVNTPDTSDDAITTQVRYGDTQNVGMSYKNPTLFTNGEWHHILLVRDKTEGKLYLYADGVLTNSANFSTTYSIYATSGKTTTNFAFGKNMTNVGGLFRGYIADVALWNVALDAADAAKLAVAGPEDIGKAPYAFFPLDEGTGTKVTDKVSGAQYPKSAGTLNWQEDPNLHRIRPTNVTVMNATLSRSRRNATITGTVLGLADNSSATVSLWAGTSSDTNSFTQVGSSVTVTNFQAFTLPWTIPSFDTTYWWQIRAADAGTSDATDAASVLAPSIVTFTGASGGDWHTGSNWETGTVPTLDDDLSINGKWVRATNSITAKSIYVKGSGIVVGGTTLTADGVKAQTAVSSTSAVPYAVTVAGDLVLDGASFSLGARREVANVSASIGGDFVITNGAVAAIYAGRTYGISPTNETMSAALLYANANVVAVGGELRVGTGSYLYPENEGLTGTPVFFKPASFTVEKGGTVSAVGRGWGKYQYSSGQTYPVGALSDANSSSYYSYAFGAGQNFGNGPSHGAVSGSMFNGNLLLVTAPNGSTTSKAFKSDAYGYAYAPFLPGSPNGVYGTPVNGAGSVCVFATGAVSVAGTITVRGTDAFYGASSGGSIWLAGATFDIARSASLTAEGGKVTGGYSSSGGAGRISLTAGATQAQLDALAAGGDPDAFSTAPLYGFNVNVLGGYKNNGAGGRSASGTATLAYASSTLPLEVRAIPEELSAATPAYGFHVFQKSDFPEAFSVADASIYPEFYRTLRRYAAQGYVVSNATGEVSGSLSAETDPLTLTWQWTGIEDLVRIRPVGGGSINVNGTAYAADTDVWFATGTPLAISAASGTGTFSAWYGDFGTGHSTDATLALAAHPGMTIWGVFSDAAAVAKSYVGADNGFWDVASNWSPAGVPTPMDEVAISSKQVKSYGLSAMKSLTLSAGKLAVGGASAATTTAQTRPTDANIVDCGLVVVSNLSATGASAISIGARRQKADLLCATIGGNLSLAGSSTLAVYAPAYDGPLGGDGKIPLTNYYHSAFPVTIGGNMELDGTAVVYPESDIVTGNSVRFDVGGDVTVGATASFNATTRGWGWISYVDEGYTDPRYTKKDGNYYTLSPGYGYSWNLGGVYGADGNGTQSGYPRKAYGLAYAPYLNGGPDGAYSTCRGGGTVWVKTAGLFTLNGSIVANGGSGPSTSSKSAGGGVWICADDFEAGSGASIRANGESGGNDNNAPGTGGRISIALAVSDADLDALARGETPSRLSYSDTITIVTATAAGGSRTSSGLTTYQPDGTLTTVMGAVSTYPLAVFSSPLTVQAEGLDYSLTNVTVGVAWSATAPAQAFAPAYPGTVRYACAGWVISNSTEQVAAGNGTTASFTPETGPFSLTWLWEGRETAGTVLSNDGELGVVAVSGGEGAASVSVWTAEAGTVSLSATPASGAEFLYWVGDVPYGQAKANPMSISANQPFFVTAVFRAAEAPTMRTWVGAAGAVGSWDDPAKWSPANIPGAYDDVVVPQGYVLATNRLEAGSLTISGSGVVSVGAKLNWDYRGQGVGYYDYAWNGASQSMVGRYTGTKLGEAALIVAGNVIVTNAGQLAIGARNQTYHSTFSIGGDLVVCGAASQSARLLIASGTTNETFSIDVGATPATIGGTFRVGTNGTAYVWSEQYTGGSVTIRAGKKFIVEAGGTVNATQSGFYRFSDRYPISLAPGLGGEYTPGGGYGGHGIGWSSGSAYANTYGFPYAPIHAGSSAGLYSSVRPAGGLIRVHAEKIAVAGTLVANGGASSSGGGIWLTSRSVPAFAAGASLSARGGDRCTGAGAPGGGGRIAICMGLTDAQIAEMAATGVVAGRNMEKYLVTEAFSAANPDVSVDVAAGEGFASGLGTFHVLDMRQAATFLLLR